MRLPTYQPNQVSQDGPTNVRVPTSVSPESFGAGLGRGVSDVGNQLARIAVREQARADDTAVTQARTAVSRWESQNLTAFHEMAGKAAMDRAGPMEKERETYLAAARKGLSPRQQRIFDQEMAPSNNAFFHNLSTKHARATSEYHDATYKDSGDAFLESVGTSAANEVQLTPGEDGAFALDTGTIQQKKADRLAQIDVYYSLNGHRFANAETAKRADIKAALTGADSMVLNGLLTEGRDTEAVAFFEQFKGEMQPQVRNQFQAKVLAAQEAGTVQRAVGEAWTASGLADPTAFDPPVAGVKRQTVTEMLDAGEALIDKQIKDPELAKDAKSQLASNVSAQGNKAENQRRERLAQQSAEIMAGAPWHEVERNLDGLEENQKTALKTQFKARMEGHYAVTDADSFDTWETMAAVDPRSFLKLDFTQLAAEQRVSTDDRAHFIGYQRAIVEQLSGSGSSGKQPGVLTKGEVVTQRITEYFGTATGDDAKAIREQRGNAAMAAHKRIAAMERGGVEVDAEAADKIMDEILGKVAFTERGMWNSLRETTAMEMLGQPGLADDDVLDAIAFLRMKNPDSAPTDEEVRALLRERDSDARMQGMLPRRP